MQPPLHITGAPNVDWIVFVVGAVVCLYWLRALRLAREGARLFLRNLARAVLVFGASMIIFIAVRLQTHLQPSQEQVIAGFVALIFFVVGLHLLGVMPMPWSGPGQVGMKRKGLVAAFLLGLIFGIALGPCTFAYMAPVLGVVFKAAKTSAIYGGSLLLAYGVGHCAVIVVAGTSTELVQRFLNWNEQSKGVAVVKCVCGVLVILGGVWLIYSAG